MARIRHIFIILLMILWVSVAKAQPADVNDSITVSGLVKIGASEPVIGASINEKGTSNRTLTDIDGRFNIKVPMGAKLVASCVGMDSAEVIVDGDSVLICMMPNRFSSIWVADGRGVLIPGFFGNIYDQDAQPLKGATITLLPSGKSVKTNHNGYFSFDDKKDDTIVRVECSGYEPVQGEFHRMDNCLTVRMEPEKASKHVLDENGKSKAQPATDVNGSITVTGQVIDRTDNDQPLIGASIS